MATPPIRPQNSYASILPNAWVTELYPKPPAKTRPYKPSLPPIKEESISESQNIQE